MNNNVDLHLLFLEKGGRGEYHPEEIIPVANLAHLLCGDAPPVYGVLGRYLGTEYRSGPYLFGSRGEARILYLWNTEYTRLAYLLWYLLRTLYYAAGIPLS